MNERELFKLQEKLIKKYKKILGDLKPKPIKLVRYVNYKGAVSDKWLRLNKLYLESASKEEIVHLFCHELNHYALKRQGHSGKFLSNMEKMGFKTTEYENSRFMDEITPEKLEGRYKEVLVKTKKNIAKFNEMKGGFETRVKILKKLNWGNFWDMIYMRGAHQGEVFRRLRIVKNKSLKELSKTLRVSASHLQELERTRDLTQPDENFEIKYPERFLKKLFYTLVNNPPPKNHAKIK